MWEKMGITYACITPHGAEIIPQSAGDSLKAFSETRRGMEAIANEIKNHNIDTIVIATSARFGMLCAAYAPE